ncbi:MAG: ABC transporter ATP-binding protein [Bacteroidales bacterium]|nr:ABC transporter ATP-binding protein [Bacteroidales bacterium]
MNSIIITEHLSKDFKDVKAVSDLNVHLDKGEIYGFLGLNGAGKTTTIRMLLGMIRPSEGSAYINGRKVNSSHNEIWEKVGYLVEIPYSYPNLTVRENLEIIRRLRFIKDRNSVDSIIENLQLHRYRNRLVKYLSQGNKQRLGLAKALIHRPEILILDEPTSGLDPAGIHDMREMFIDLSANKGVTIFVSSHILGEVSLFASRIGIIHHGRLVREFKRHDLDILCEKQLHVQAKDLTKALNIIRSGGYGECNLSGDMIIIKDKKAIDKPEEISILMVNNDCPPTYIKVAEENLESFFLKTIKINGG